MEYLERKKRERPNLAATTEDQLYELTGITRDGEITMTALLLFLCLLFGKQDSYRNDIP